MRSITDFYIIKVCFSDCHATGKLLTFDRTTIGYILKGSAYFLHNGKRTDASAGDIIYISRGTKYYSVWNGNPEIEFYSIVSLFTPNSMGPDLGFRIIKGVGAEKFHSLYDNYNSKKEYFALSDLYSIFGEITALCPEENKNAYATAVEKAVEYIDVNYASAFDAEFLARLCGFSVSRFFAVFKAAMGCTPVEYKNNILMQHAIDMLSTTNETVEAISDKLMFSSPSYFRRVFKKLTGKLPKEIRMAKS